MTGYTYRIKERERGEEKIDVCNHCRERLGLPPSTQRSNVRVERHDSSLYRPDPCLGCGASATSFADGEGRRKGAASRGAGALAIVLNIADTLDVFVTVDAQTEEVPVGGADGGATYAKVVRQVPDSPEALHLMVLNNDGEDREAMEARCKELVELLAVNGWDGAPRPNGDGDTPDWEIWAVEADEEGGV